MSTSPTNLDRGERYVRQMPAGERQESLEWFSTHDYHHSAQRRDIIRAEMLEGLEYARYFKVSRHSSPAQKRIGGPIRRVHVVNPLYFAATTAFFPACVKTVSFSRTAPGDFIKLLEST
ncbi:hypothetical protein R3P38DRAFT_2761594 [Favolaschia claudopus]|uniref:Uncharacterized protein n=1 Tax=Favolaschia claudopus TaxID=2862362 RepID=A0AAW0DMQ1_9AGAR